MFKNFIFDLDGTLLETLPDIARAINEALANCGFPYVYDIASCKKLIGDGADNLIHRALKNEDSPENFATLKKSFMPLYHSYQGQTSGAMKGAKEMLEVLRKRGCGLFVCTNKPNHLAHDILDVTFGKGVFRAIKGLREGETPKPDPWAVNYIIDAYGLIRSETLFVGDSLTDYLTAKNSGLPFCLCLYGYGNYVGDLLSKSDYCIKEPLELLEI